MSTNVKIASCYGVSIFCVFLLGGMNVYSQYEAEKECESRGGQYKSYECYKTIVPMEDK
jgi:hypothetical protein